MPTPFAVRDERICNTDIGWAVVKKKTKTDQLKNIYCGEMLDVMAAPGTGCVKHHAVSALLLVLPS
jgi:hypothetical protein